MKKVLRTSIVCLLVIPLVSACGPGQLFGPTVTPTPTFIPRPTETPLPTQTPIPTSTATAEPTQTPLPPTATSVPASVDSGEIGSSFENPVVIEANNDWDGIAMEYQWLDEHYPGYQNESQALTFYNDKPFDIITIITADGQKLDIYFDISMFYGKF